MKFANLESIQSIAVVGATGLVGREFLEILAEHRIRVPKLKLLASSSSLGDSMEVDGLDAEIEALGPNSFRGVEVAFFSVPTEVTRRYVPVAMESGCLVVDDSSVYRMHPEVPLVIPEVNGAVLRDFQGKIISTPNCTTTPLALVLKPLAERFGLRRIVASTYQSVSGAGKAAYEELSKQTISLMNGEDPSIEAFPHRIAFNCLPQIGAPLENGNTEEEEKVVKETRKILGLRDLPISCTAVRVPTFCGHALSVNIDLKKDFGSVDEVRELLDQSPGLKVVDKPEMSIYPTSVEAAGSDYAFVGRVRRDTSIESGLNLWVITDNLRKGAALNVLQCLETLFAYRRMS